jgi:hypothetical protein
MVTRVRLLVLAALVASAVACQQPSDSAAPIASSGPGGGTPVAPAIEPGQPTPEHPIELPGGDASPVAPAIEPGQPSPEPTIEFNPS